MYFKTEEIRIDNLPYDMEEFKKTAVEKWLIPLIQLFYLYLP